MHSIKYTVTWDVTSKTKEKWLILDFIFLTSLKVKLKIKLKIILHKTIIKPFWSYMVFKFGDRPNSQVFVPFSPSKT